MGTLSFAGLTLPIFIELILNNLMGTVSTAVLSDFQEEAAAAAGTVNIVFTLFSVLFTGLVAGISVTVSNQIGQNNTKEAEQTSFFALILNGGIGAVAAVFLHLMGDVLIVWMKLTGEMQALAVIYLRIRGWSLPLLAISAAMLALLRCIGRVKAAVVIGITKNICNLAASIYAVYCAELPALSGIRGVALGCVMSELVSVLILSVIFSRSKLRLRRNLDMGKFFRFCGKCLRIAIPASISGSSFTLTQLITNAFAAMIGASAVLGKVYFSNILCYAYLFSSAVAQANTIFMGQLYGAGKYDQADRLNKGLLCFTIPVNLLISVGITVLRKPLLGMFTQNTEILQMSVSVMLIDLVIEQARAVSHVYEYALRGCGDVMPTMTVTLLTGWVFGVGLAYFLSIPCGLGLAGCWIGLALDEAGRALFTYFRWRTGKWKPDVKRLYEKEYAI